MVFKYVLIATRWNDYRSYCNILLLIMVSSIIDVNPLMGATLPSLTKTNPNYSIVFALSHEPN